MIFQTTRDAGHNHSVVYIAPYALNGKGAGLTSIGKNDAGELHQHTVLELGNGSLSVMPDPTDGHTHQIEAFIPGKGDPLIDEEERRKALIKFKHDFSLAEQVDMPYFANGRVCEAFLLGKHWTEEELSARSAKGIPSPVVNLILPGYRKVESIYIGQMEGIKTSPVERGDVTRSNILGAFLLDIQERSNFKMHRLQAFMDMYVTARGCLEVVIDPYETVDGPVLRIKRRPWEETLFGPHELNDCSDCQFVIKLRWVPIEEAKESYPLYADKIQEDMDVSLNGVAQDGGSFFYSDSTLMVYWRKREGIYVRVMEYEVRKLMSTVRIEDLKNGEPLIISNKWSDKQMRAAATISGLKVTEGKVRGIQENVYIGGILVSQANTRHRVFSVSPAYATKRKDIMMSAIEPMLDPQRFFNKRFAQKEVMASSLLWPRTWIPRDSLTPDQLLNLQRNGNSENFLGVFDGPQKPEREQPGRVPGELFTAMGQDAQLLREIGGTAEIYAAIGEGLKIGTPATTAQRQNVSGNEHLFTNMRICLENIGRRLLESLSIYSLERIERLLMNNQAETTLSRDKQTGKPIRISDYNEGDIVNLLNMVDLADYDVEVEISPLSATQRQMNIASAIEMGREQLMSPAIVQKAYFDNSDMANKEEYQAMAAQEQAAASQQLADRPAVEVVKTVAKEDPKVGKDFLIARGVIPNDNAPQNMGGQEMG